MKFRAHRRQPSQVNLTPLIDVVFLLLIFFMVSTTFTDETELRVELPEADTAPAENQPDTIVLSVNAEGNYALNDRALASRSIENLMEALNIVTEGQTDVALVISADAKASHQSVVRAMDAAGRLGIERLRIAAQEPTAND